MMTSDWTLETVQALKTMAHDGEPASAIAMRLAKDLHVVRAKLLQLGIAPAPDLRDSDRGDAETGEPARPGAAREEVRLHTL
jgi:hypothetical protein